MCKYTCSLLHSLIQDFLCLSLHSLSSIVQFSSGYQRCTLDTFISAFYSGHFHMYLTLIKSKSISIQQLTVPVRCWLMGHLTQCSALSWSHPSSVQMRIFWLFWYPWEQFPTRNKESEWAAESNQTGFWCFSSEQESFFVACICLFNL